MTLHYTDLTRNTAAPSADFMSQLAQPVPAYSKPRFSLYRTFFKRVGDLALLVLTAPLTVSVILLLALAVWARTGGNPFYTQPRVGRGGKIFTMVKLRTMVMDADQRLVQYLDINPDAREEWDRDQKLKNDPRVTGFGRLLRKTSLDELPQLWNVFLGEMSLVGPRPMMVAQKEIYPGLDYYDLRPGLTGSWQISKRNETSFAQRAMFDSQYNQTVSPSTDAAIILKTFSAIYKGTGY